MTIPVIDTDEYDKEYVAIVTPYERDSLKVDEEAFRKHVRYFTTSNLFVKGNGAIIVNPEAGEIFYLTDEERRRNIEIVLKERPKGMPVFAGCYGVRREEVIRCALDAKELGVDGIFVLPPTGTEEVTIALDGTINPEIWTNHIGAIAKATKLPLIIHASHALTSTYGKGIPLENAKMILDKVTSIVGWKFIASLSGFYIVASYLRSLKRHVGVLNTPDQVLQMCISSLIDYRTFHDGAVNGGLNWFMEPYMELHNAFKDGDLEKAKSIMDSPSRDLWNYVYSGEGYYRLHIRYKIATWIRGNIPHPFMRPPMPPPRKYEVDKIFELVVKSGLSHISKSEIDKTWERKDLILKDNLGEE